MQRESHRFEFNLLNCFSHNRLSIDLNNVRILFKILKPKSAMNPNLDHCCICLAGCGDAASKPSDISEIINIFLKCYSESDLIITPHHTQDLNVCSKCSSRLIRLNRINRLISQLQSEATHIKSTLTATILSQLTSLNRPIQFNPNSGLISELNEIKSRILDEYSCQVQLPRLEELEIFSNCSEFSSNLSAGSYHVDGDSPYIDVDVDIKHFLDFKSENSDSSQADQSGKFEEIDPDFQAFEIHQESAEENFESLTKVSKKSARKIGPRSRKQIYARDAALIRVIPPVQSRFLIDGFEIIEGNNGIFYCVNCGSKRAKRAYMLDHIRNEHAPTSKFTCRHSVVMDLGGGKYSRGSFVVEKSDERFVCLTCGVTSRDLARAIYHVNQEHFQETVAEFTPTPAERKKGIRTNEIANGQFEYLGRPFKFEESLNKFSCGICGILRIRKREIGVHMREAHFNEDGYEPLPAAKTVMCEECGKTFQRASRLEVHVMAAHRGPQFKCEQCGKQFKWIASLRKHEIVAHRDDVDKFMCRFCGRTFKFTHELTLHERHHSEDGFPCGTCDQVFKTYWLFRKHRRVVHGEVKLARVVVPSQKKPKRKKKKSAEDLNNGAEFSEYFSSFLGQNPEQIE